LLESVIGAERQTGATRSRPVDNVRRDVTENGWEPTRPKVVARPAGLAPTPVEHRETGCD